MRRREPAQSELGSTCYSEKVSAPYVSICIPTFDRLTYLREAVASARAQTMQNIEIVISDDGDSSELKAWCQGQAALDARVRYEKTPRRLRLAGNWNFLVGLARGEYVTLMGDDDRLLSTFTECLADTAHRYQADVVFSNHYVINAKGEQLREETAASTRDYRRATLKGGPVDDIHNLVWSNSVPMAASIVRTTAVRRLGFKADINTPELELFVRMAVEGACFVFVPDYLMEYRVHDTSETSRGLTVDRLAEYLQDIIVPASAESAKREILQILLVGGVNRRLNHGDVPGARSLKGSPYYPRGVTSASVAAQRVLLALPDPFVAPAYVSVRRLARALRTVRRARPI